MRSYMTGIAEPEEPITGYDDLGDIHSGDLNQGDGVSTAQLGRVTVSPFSGDRNMRADAADIAAKGTVANLVDNVFGQKSSGGSLGVLVVAIVALIGIKMLTEKHGEAAEFATTRIGLENWFINTLMVMTGFYAVTVGVSLWPTNGPIITNIREFVAVAK